MLVELWETLFFKAKTLALILQIFSYHSNFAACCLALGESFLDKASCGRPVEDADDGSISVIEPSMISAAKANVSARVGWACTVLLIVRKSAPISSASTAS